MTKNPYRRLIGILGGMGPAATVDFISKIVAATPALVDQDHIPLIVHSVPQIPDRSACIQQGSDAPFLPMLAGARMLEASGVDLIVIPCNTAHFWHDRLGRSCRVTVMHIADAALAALNRVPMNGKSVALMATRGTITSEIYHRRLIQAGINLLVPDEVTQQNIDRTIAMVKANDMARAALTAESVARSLLNNGAHSLLLACTELPIALRHAAFRDSMIDATQALADACVSASIGVSPNGLPIGGSQNSRVRTMQWLDQEGLKVSAAPATMAQTYPGTDDNDS